MVQEEKNKTEIERLTKALQAYEQEVRPVPKITVQPPIQMPIT